MSCVEEKVVLEKNCQIPLSADISVKLRSHWRAFRVNFLFLLGMHAAKWVQHPLENETNAPYLRLIAHHSVRHLWLFI